MTGAGAPCAICSEPVDDLVHALVEPETDEPAHFECVIQSIQERESLNPHEEICYIGGGEFGIFNTKPMRGSARIRKRIQYESESSVPDWRRGLANSLRAV